MKRSIYIFLTFFLLATISCKKEDLLTKSAAGTWELRQIGGGISGKITSYNVGNGSFLKFTDDTYQIFSDKKLVKSGSYKIVKEKSILSQQEGNRIIYDGDVNAGKVFISIDHNMLYLSTDVYDGEGSIYEKIE